MTSPPRLSRLVARPEISTENPKTLQAFLTPHFSRLSSRSADPGSANAASDGDDAHMVSVFLRLEETDHFNLVRKLEWVV